MKKLFILTVSVVALASCTSKITTKLKDPETGKIVTCEGEKTNYFSAGPVSFSEDNTDSCVQNYLDQGYTRESSFGGIF